jgi:hypothetical protein
MDYDKVKLMISKKRSFLSPNSINMYVRNLKILMEGLGFDNIDNFEDYNKVLEYIKNEKNRKGMPSSINTQKNRISSIVVVLSSMNKEKYEDLIGEYQKILLNYSNELKNKKEDLKGGLNEKEKENFITMKEMKKAFNYYNNKINERKIKTNKRISPADRYLLQQFLVISLYTLLPPVRNDYANVMVEDREDYDELDEDEKDNKNFIIFNKDGTKEIILNDYKTSKYLGSIEKELTKYSNISKILNLWRKHNQGSTYLLKTKTGDKMSRNTLTKFINILFRPLYPNKKISTTIMRKAFSSKMEKQKFKKNKVKMENDAKFMGHTLNQQLETYNKNVE